MSTHEEQGDKIEEGAFYSIDVNALISPFEKAALVERVKENVSHSNARFLELSFTDGLKYPFKAIGFIVQHCMITSFVIEQVFFFLCVVGIALGYFLIFFGIGNEAINDNTVWMRALGGNALGFAFLTALPAVCANYAALRRLSLRTERLLFKSTGEKGVVCCRYSNCTNSSILLLIMGTLIIPDFTIAYTVLYLSLFFVWVPVIGILFQSVVLGCLITERMNFVFWIVRSQIKSYHKWKKRCGSAIFGFYMGTGLLLYIPFVNLFVPYIAMVAFTKLVLHQSILRTQTREQLTGIPFEGDIPNGLESDNIVSEGIVPNSTQQHPMSGPVPVGGNTAIMHPMSGPVPVGKKFIQPQMIAPIEMQGTQNIGVQKPKGISDASAPMQQEPMLFEPNQMVSQNTEAYIY